MMQLMIKSLNTLARTFLMTERYITNQEKAISDALVSGIMVCLINMMEKQDWMMYVCLIKMFWKDT